MKKIFILIVVIVCSHDMSAQIFSKERVQNLQNFDKSRFSYGYILGLNLYDFDFNYKKNASDTDIIVDTNYGFSVGLLGNLRLNDYFDLRLEPVATFSSRDLTFTHPSLVTENERIREVKSTYIHVPLLLKISTKRLNNIKPFLVMGIGSSYNLSSNEENPDDNSKGQFRMKTIAGYYELGFGIDLYLYYFKFTPSLRGVFAATDELVKDSNRQSPYTSTIDKMSTRGVFLNFTFQ